MRCTPVPWILVAIAAAGGCSSDNPVPPASSTVGAAGGTVRSGTTSITIPAGALSTSVTVSVRTSATAAQIEGIRVAGPTIEIGPTGTSFGTPARVTIPFNASAIPSGRSAADVVVYQASAVGGPYTALATAVDAAAGTASADVSHLSFFAAGVPEPVSSTCPEVNAAAPLSIGGSIVLDRYIRRMCHDGNQLTVLSFTPDPSSPNVIKPGQYYVSVHDSVSLSKSSETPTQDDDLPAGNCAPYPTRIGPSLDPPRFLFGSDTTHGIAWSATFRSVGEWTRTELTVERGGAKLLFSFNAHLNTPTPVDTQNPFTRSAGLAGRILADGTARFYLHTWYAATVDIIQLGDVEGMLANPSAFVGTDGFHTPSARQRLDLGWNNSAGSSYHFDPIHLEADPDNASADIVTVFARPGAVQNTAMRGYRVTRAAQDLSVEALPSLGLPVFYDQLGWHNAGRDSRGRLVIQSQVAQFETSMLAAIDPSRFTLAGSWELGCIAAPTLKSFQRIPGEGGRVLRLAEGSRIMFIKDGVIESFGTRVLGVEPLTLVVTGTVRRAYVANESTGEIVSVALPPAGN